jgi:hypothetical protein
MMRFLGHRNLRVDDDGGHETEQSGHRDVSCLRIIAAGSQRLNRSWNLNSPGATGRGTIEGASQTRRIRVSPLMIDWSSSVFAFPSRPRAGSGHVAVSLIRQFEAVFVTPHQFRLASRLELARGTAGRGGIRDDVMEVGLESRELQPAVYPASRGPRPCTGDAAADGLSSWCRPVSIDLVA